MIPSKLKIGPYDYTVTVEDKDWLDQHEKYGHCDDERKQISIVLQDTPATVDTLLHETMHACYSLMNLKDKEGEETTVTRLATALTMVFRDNPDLVELLRTLYETPGNS